MDPDRPIKYVLGWTTDKEKLSLSASFNLAGGLFAL
jgi:hypothetical protein